MKKQKKKQKPKKTKGRGARLQAKRPSTEHSTISVGAEILTTAPVKPQKKLFKDAATFVCPRVVQDFNRFTAIEIYRDESSSYHVLINTEGLEIKRMTPDDFDREFFRELDYDAKLAAAKFIDIGKRFGITESAKKYLEDIINAQEIHMAGKKKGKAAAKKDPAPSNATVGSALAAAAAGKSNVVGKEKVAKSGANGSTRTRHDEADKISWIAKDNPRRKGTGSHSRFEKYFGTKTVGEYFAKGGGAGDLRWDVEHGYLKVGA